MSSTPFEVEMELEHKAELCDCSHCQIFEKFVARVDNQAQTTSWTNSNWGITVGVGSIVTLSAGVCKETVIVTPSGRLPGRFGEVPSSTDFEFVEYFSEDAHMEYAKQHPVYFSNTISKNAKNVLKQVLVRDGKMDQILSMSSAAKLCRLCTGHAIDLNQENHCSFSKRKCGQKCQGLVYKDYCKELDIAVDHFFASAAQQDLSEKVNPVDPSEEDKARMRSTLTFALVESAERSKMKTEWQMKPVTADYTGDGKDVYQLIQNCHNILSSEQPIPSDEIANSIDTMYSGIQSYFNKSAPPFMEEYFTTMRMFTKLEPDVRVEVFQALQPTQELSTTMKDFLRNPPALLVQIRKTSKRLLSANLNKCQRGILGRYRDVISQSTVELNELMLFFNWCAEDNFVEVVNDRIASGAICASEVQKIKFSAYNKKNPLKRCNFCELRFETYLCHAGNFLKKTDAPPTIVAPVVAPAILTIAPQEKKAIGTHLKTIMNDKASTNMYVASLVGDVKTFAKQIITRKNPNWIFE